MARAVLLALLLAAPVQSANKDRKLQEPPPLPGSRLTGASPAAPGLPSASPPYFLAALARHGLPAEAQASLQAYLETPRPGVPGNPAGPDYDAADLMASLLDQVPPQEVNRHARIVHILAAALYRIHPRAPPGRPASAGETIGYLRADPASQALLERFASHLGLSPANLLGQLHVAIARIDPKEAGAFEGLLASQYEFPPQREKVRRLAQTLAAAAKAAAALRRGQEPDLELVPKEYRKPLAQGVADLARRRAGVVKAPVPERSRGRAPPEAERALQRARDEARDLAPDGAVRPRTELGGLAAAGYAVIPAGDLLEAGERGRLEAEARERLSLYSDTPFKFWELYDRPRGWIGDSDGAGVVRALAERLLSELRRRFPDEAIELRDVQIRTTLGETAGGERLHVDGGYLTACWTLEGPGTLLYPIDRGKAGEFEASNDDLALVTSREREIATGIPGTVHSAPLSVPGGRAVLIIRFSRPSSEPGQRERSRTGAKIAARLALVEQQLGASRRARTAKPADPGLLRRLFGEDDPD